MLDGEKLETETFTDATPLLQKSIPVVPAQECRQHVQLLRCFVHLRQTVSKTKGLFKTEHIHEIKNELDPTARQFMADDRRWSIYVSRAIHRFSVWWHSLPVTSSPGLSFNESPEKLHGQHNAWAWTEKQMPPLDILMVFHALTLHTKAFREDCLRHQKMALWNEGFPLQLASQYIDPNDLKYSCPESCKLHFEHTTKLAWDNVDDPGNLSIECFRCHEQTVVPWTTRRGNGLADDGFSQVCHWCKFILRRDGLIAHKFRRDLHLLLETNIPLPGTCWGLERGDLTAMEEINGFVKQSLAAVLLEETRPTNLSPNMNQIIGASTEAVGSDSLPMLHDIFEHYDYVGNSSCNLHTAVMEVSKMASTLQNADWLDSNLLSSQMESQYLDFLRGQSKESSRRPAPDTDTMHPLDLLWGTHLLRPRSYCEFFRRFGNKVPVGWERPHEPQACSLCHTLCPPSFARRFIRGLTSLSEWKEWISTV